MTNKKIIFDEKSLKHLTEKIVNAIPNELSKLDNDNSFVSEDYVREKVERTSESKRMKSAKEGKDAIISDSGISNVKTWSSSKIDSFILENNKEIDWQDVPKSFNPTVEHTIDGVMKEVEIFGNTWQDRDSRNIFDGSVSILWIDVDGTVKEGSTNYSVITNIDVGKKYVINKTFGVSWYCFLDNTNRIVGKAENSTKTVEAPPNSKKLLWYIAPRGIHREDLSGVQIEEGSESTEYEPYHKGDLSDIRHVGEYDEESGKYKVEIVSGTTKLNREIEKSDILASFVDTTPYDWKLIYVKKELCEKIISILNNEVKSLGEVENIYDYYYIDGNKAWVCVGRAKDSITLDMALENLNSKIKSSKQTLLLPYPLSKIGNVQDRLYWDGEKYVVEKNIYKIILNGEEDWKAHGFGAVWNYQDKIPEINHIQSSNNLHIYMNNRISQQKLGTTGVSHLSISKDSLPNGTPLREIFVYIEGYTNNSQGVDMTKQWLSQNNIDMYYQLRTPQLIETDTTEQIFIPTYKNKTYFFIKGGLDGEIKGKVPVDKEAAISNLVFANQNLKNDFRYQQLEDNKQDEKLSHINSNLSTAFSLIQKASILPEVEETEDNE